jgi:hypothetical protein
MTVNSISGGKTSSYMAVHYPADINIFAIVAVDDPACALKDKGLEKWIHHNKLHSDMFIGTVEDDKTIRVIIDLEQKIGKEIKWVRGISFDRLNQKRKAVPNKSWRFCTTEMKLRPIAEWWFYNGGGIHRVPCDMRIGFRYDEAERKETITTSFPFIVGKRATRNKWEDIEWRRVHFPLIDNKINHFTVKKWADKSGLDFPEDSNCIGCFWKNPQRLRKNWEVNPEKMQWFANQEGKGRRWQDGMSYEMIKKIGLQQDFDFEGPQGCNSGECTP